MDAVALTNLLTPYLKQKQVARFQYPESASGHCKDASFRLAAWLEDELAGLHIPVSVLNLAEPQGFDVSLAQRFWQTNLPYASHYVVRASELTIDLTARQFDVNAPFPLILPLVDLAAHWGLAFDLAEPLSAGPIWTNLLWGSPGLSAAL